MTADLSPVRLLLVGGRKPRPQGAVEKAHLPSRGRSPSKQLLPKRRAVPQTVLPTDARTTCARTQASGF